MGTQTQQRLDVSQVGDVTVVCSRERRIIEDQQIQEMGQQLFDLVETRGFRFILIDFGSVDFASSAMYGKLITLDKMTKAKGGLMILCAVPLAIYEVFAITRLDRLFWITEDQEQAMAKFAELATGCLEGA